MSTTVTFSQTSFSVSFNPRWYFVLSLTVTANISFATEPKESYKTFGTHPGPLSQPNIVKYIGLAKKMQSNFGLWRVFKEDL